MGTIGVNFAPALTAMEHFRQSVGRTNAAFIQMQRTMASPQSLAAQTRMVNLRHKESIITKNLASAELSRARAQEILARAGQQALRTQREELRVQEQTLRVDAQRARVRNALLRNTQTVEAQQARAQQALARAGQDALRTQREELRIQRETLRVQEQRVRAQTAMAQRERAQVMAAGAVGGTGGAGGGGQRDAYSFMGSLSHRAGWFASSVAFFGTGMIMSTVLENMGKVEGGMIQLQRVSSDLAFSFERMKQGLLDVGLAYGHSWETVQDVALRWEMAGYSMQETLHLTEMTLLAVNNAEMSVEEGTQSLIGILSQWGLAADDLEEVIDKLNITSDRFPVTTQDLIDGMLRSSGVARAMGISFEENIAILTAMREASGRTGREVGNAWNTVLAYMQRDTALKQFENLGINVWADETQTEFRNIMEIFDQVAERWDTAGDDIKDAFVAAAEEAGLFSEEVAEASGAMEEFDAMEQRNLTQSMAGVRRRNYLIALISNWSRTYDVLANMQDVHGYTMKQNEQVMETYEKKVEQLGIALTALADIIGETGLMGGMKGLLDSITGGINAFREWSPHAQSIIIHLTELLLILMTLNVALRTFAGAGIGSAVIGFANLSAAIAGSTARARELSAAFTLIHRHPILIAITALAGGFIFLHKKIKAAKEEQEKFVKSQVDAYNSAKDQIREIESLRDQYMALREKTELTTDEQEKLKRVTAEIHDLVPSVIIGFDDMGDAISTVGSIAEGAAHKIGLLRGEMALAAKIAATEARLLLPEKREELRIAESDRDFWQKQLGTTEDVRHVVEKANILGMSITGIEITPAKDVDRMYQEASLAVDKSRLAITELVNAQRLYRAIESGELDTGKRDTSHIPEPTPTGDKGKGSASKAKTWLDNFGEALKNAVPPEVIRALYLVQEALDGVSDRSSTLTELQTHLNWKFQEGIGTQEDYTKLQNTVAEKTMLLQKEQKLLNSANEVLNQQLPHLNSQLQTAAQRYEQMAKANNVEGMRQANEAYQKAREAISAVTQEIDKNTAALYANERAMHELSRAMEDVYNKQFDKAVQQMDYLTSIARLSTDQQIAHLKRLSDAHEWEAAKRQQVNSKLFSLYRQQLDEEMDRVRDAYDERIALIDKETKAKVDAIQAEIDALDEEGKLDDRAKSREDHEGKIADLLEKRRYHEIRTGREHEQAIFDIDKEIAEERQKWEEQQTKWQRDDKKKSLQDEVKDIQDASNKKKKELEKYYNQALKLLNSATRDMLASLALENDKWFGQGKSWADQLVEGFLSGQPLDQILADIQRGVPSHDWGDGGIGDIIGGIEGQDAADKKRVAYLASGMYVNDGGTAIMPARDLGSALGKSVDWDSATKTVVMGGKSFSPYKLIDGVAYLAVRPTAQAFGYNVGWERDGITIDQAHTGAYVRSSGVAELLKGERVLSPDLTTSFDQLARAVSQTNHFSMDGNFDRAADRIVRAIEQRMKIDVDKLLNIEEFVNEDRVDVDVLANTIRRAVNLR